MDDDLLGLRLGVAGYGPYQGDDPADKGPAQEEIQDEDGACIGFFSYDGNDRGEEIRAKDQYGEAAGDMTKEEKESEYG